MNIASFKAFSKQDITSLIRLRRFETKLGEQIQLLHDVKNVAASLENLKARYVIFGVPEEVGILANYGRPGSSNGWISFLKHFLNLQSNDFFAGDEVAVIGYFDFAGVQQLVDQNAHDPEERIVAYRHALHTIDEEVEGLVKAIVAAGKVPVAIGGGHNNAYPLIKGTAKGLSQLQKLPLPQINCINLDAYSGYGPMEGRHSGNAFRYAEEDNFLQKYFVLGLQENYLPQNVWMDVVNNPFIDCITYEDIFIHEKRSFFQAVADAINFVDDDYFGVELDVSSLYTNEQVTSITGISLQQARQYVSVCAANSKATYLNISCNVAFPADVDDSPVGPVLSLLVSDFIKMHNSH